MADISKITLPSGTTYDIKDAWSRQQIEALGNYTVFLGVTTTALTDGATTNPVTIAGESVTAKTGDIVTYGSQEFIFNGTKWQAFGDLSALGELAFVDSASGSFTPAGTVSKPTFTGSSSSVTITAADNTNGNYQPKGTVSKPTFTGAAMTSTGTYTPSGSVSLTNTNQTATVSKAASGTATYTPEGTVAAPTISVATAGSTATIKNPTSQTVAKTVVAAAPGATAPANALTYYAVSGETLSLYQLGYTTGASITTANVTVKTGDAAYEATAPAFTGTGARLVTGNISVPSSASFTGTEGSVSVSGTTTGSVSQPTFTGTKAQISGTVTPSGTVSQPTFTGTAGTVTVTPAS
jgi:hypothetical protein